MKAIADDLKDIHEFILWPTPSIYKLHTLTPEIGMRTIQSEVVSDGCYMQCEVHTGRFRTRVHVELNNSRLLLVPVGFRVAVQSREHNGQNLCCVVADQTHDVLVVPVVQSSLCHLQETIYNTSVRHLKKSLVVTVFSN